MVKPPGPIKRKLSGRTEQRGEGTRNSNLLKSYHAREAANMTWVWGGDRSGRDDQSL